MNHGRRGTANRPASSEEKECWSTTASSLEKISKMYDNPSRVETIGRTNRLISAWPTDDSLPSDGFDGVKKLYKNLSSGLNEIKSNAEAETKALDDALEHISILIGLRKASEAAQPEQRAKRPRIASPAASSAPGTPSLGTIKVNGNGTARSSVGPSPAIPFSREPKARREALAAQLPLQRGRKVAFFNKGGQNGSGAPLGEDAWILAVILECINQDKNRYRVQDVEQQEDGQPGADYKTTLRQIMPLPDPNAPPNSATHLNAYQEFSKGSTVMALYPDTSCFYRAEVTASPSDVAAANKANASTKTYMLKFEDDDDQEHAVSAYWVVEWPGTG